jgi:lipopolysaccharide transport system ATP-binding protein
MFVKLAFSVAAHLDSEIMIMDEVLAVGDMAFQKKCLTKMRSAAKEDGRTVLYVSHNMNTIRQLCDRCIVLDKGRIVFDGDVEKAIALYLNMGVQEQAVHVDLSDKRMSHLPEELVVKMQHIHLEGKEDACYEMNELLPFTLTVKAHKQIRELCVRLEIRTESAEPCGTTILQNFASMEAGQVSDFRFVADLRGLVPGNYVGLLVLYEVTESGEFNDLDAVLPAFCFEVRDVLGRQGIHWVTSAWGYMQFPDMTVRDEYETENSIH